MIKIIKQWYADTRRFKLSKKCIKEKRLEEAFAEIMSTKRGDKKNEYLIWLARIIADQPMVDIELAEKCLNAVEFCHKKSAGCFKCWCISASIFIVYIALLKAAQQQKWQFNSKKTYLRVVS